MRRFVFRLNPLAAWRVAPLLIKILSVSVPGAVPRMPSLFVLMRRVPPLIVVEEWALVVEERVSVPAPSLTSDPFDRLLVMKIVPPLPTVKVRAAEPRLMLSCELAVALPSVSVPPSTGL